ncbi:MAG TPA: methylenetetrahydrofolate--tRNA-(uracil(54)-C(5))-methyltransferase (FADH(2)-oxidizing) TrmFO [bacterium]|nr:methylenetetrahydrofolate--tRNA-(uracil(54)-C(5))-methyltransferase (FADH(2)-oxidizing) TrmFO [bacterium]
MNFVRVIGGGLAGAEAAFQLARRGLRVRLLEARPQTPTPAHTSAHLAELVCSNSLGSNAVGTGKGVLFAEMQACDSLIERLARAHAVPAGKAVAVDRERFAQAVTEAIEAEPNIELIRREVEALPDAPVIVATGPLTTDNLARELARIAGTDHLHFYDATSPIVDGASIDRTIVFSADRRGEGEGDYLNCPLDKDEYDAFYRALMNAELVTPHEFEDARVFEGCMPIEQIARRGVDTLRFGPMRPVGLTDPRTDRRPYAVVQLRREDVAGDAWNLVGFQTRMTFAAQREVLRLLPGLAGLRLLRYGVIHRNTYLDGPRVLDASLALRNKPGVRVAGQITGVEGYLESAAMGLLAARFTADELAGRAPSLPPADTMIGALLHYVTTSERQPIEPMNANFGLLPSPEGKMGRAARKEAMHAAAIRALREWLG